MKIYVQATTLLKNDDCESLLKAEELFCSISDYRDSTEKALQCKRRYDEIINQESAELQAINESILNEVLEKKNGLLKKIDELKEQIGTIDNKIIKLNAEKETLTGFFAAGKRKEIERTIDSLARDKSAMNASISEIKSDVQKTDAQYMELKNQADLGVDLRTIVPKESSVKIVAGCACKVFKIIAQKGSRVRKGDTVIVVEALKMEIPVVAPTDGVVSTINVSVGESIDAGFVVATMNE